MAAGILYAYSAVLIKKVGWTKCPGRKLVFQAILFVVREGGVIDGISTLTSRNYVFKLHRRDIMVLKNSRYSEQVSECLGLIYLECCNSSTAGV